MQNIMSANLEDIPAKFNEKNILGRYQNRVDAIMAGKIVAPYEVIIHASSTCNLACDWCIGDHVPIVSPDGTVLDAAKTVAVTLENALHSVDNMLLVVDGMLDYRRPFSGDCEASQKIERFSFSGLIGEPLIAKRAVLAAIDRIAGQNRKVGLFTNGVLIDDRAIKTLLRAEYVNVSLDAGTAGTYQALKSKTKLKGRVFEKVITNLQALTLAAANSQNSNLEVNASYILYPENFHEVFDAAVLLKDVGVRHMRVKRDNSGNRRLNSKQNVIVQDLLNRIDADLCSDDFRLVRIHSDDDEANVIRQFKSCRITDLTTAIGSDGGVYPCNYHPRPDGHSYGNLIENSFTEIWEGEQRKRLRATLPKICPAVCEPFKMRANAFLERSAEVERTQVLETIGSS